MPLHSTQKFTLYSGTVLSAADQASASIPVGNFIEAVIYIRITAKSGTTPDIALDVETSDDNSNWHKLQDVTTITDPTVTHKADAVKITNFGKHVRLNNPAAPGGSGTPTLTIDAILVAKN